jgi:hypothetical protein
LGFYLANGAENQINNFIDYKDWLVFEKYRKFSGDIEVFLKYAEVQAKDKTTIY